MTRKRRGRVFLISFAITLVALSAVGIGLVLVSQEIPNTNIPSQLPDYSASWASYVPQDVLQVSYLNFSAIRQLNSSALPSGPLLELTTPNATILHESVRELVTVAFTAPNETLDLAFLDKPAFSSLASLFGSGQGTGPSLFFTQAREGGRLVTGWVALVPGDRLLEFAPGASYAKEVIQLSLQAANGTLGSIFQRDDVRQGLFVLNGTEGHLAFAVQEFPGVVRTGQMTMIAVDEQSEYMRVSYAVEFSDSSNARANLGYMKTSYLGAQSVSQYDSFLKAVQFDHFSRMETDTRLVG